MLHEYSLINSSHRSFLRVLNIIKIHYLSILTLTIKILTRAHNVTRKTLDYNIKRFCYNKLLNTVLMTSVLLYPSSSFSLHQLNKKLAVPSPENCFNLLKNILLSLSIDDRNNYKIFMDKDSMRLSSENPSTRYLSLTGFEIAKLLNNNDENLKFQLEQEIHAYFLGITE